MIPAGPVFIRRGEVPALAGADLLGQVLVAEALVAGTVGQDGVGGVEVGLDAAVGQDDLQAVLDAAEDDV